jgi:hypothetical protein
MKTGRNQAGKQDDATGFIRLNALRLKVAAWAQGSKQKTKVKRCEQA